MPTEKPREVSNASIHKQKKVDDSQETLDGFVSPGKKRASNGKASHILSVAQISDSKTRKGKSIPHHVDTLPARIQLMLYWRLFLEVMTLDMTKAKDFFDRMGLDPQASFSETFRTEMVTIAIDSELSLSFLDATCLQDTVQPFAETISNLRIRDEADTDLRLVYRRRGRPMKRRKTVAKDNMKSITASLDDDASNNEEDVRVDESRKEVSNKTPDYTIKKGDDTGDANSPGSKKRKRSESSLASSSGSESEGSASGLSFANYYEIVY